VPSIRDDVGDRFDAIYEGAQHRLGTLSDDAQSLEVADASSTIEGTSADFTIDASAATGWTPDVADQAPVLTYSLPRRPDINYIELTVVGALPGTEIDIQLLDVNTTGIELEEDRQTIQLTDELHQRVRTRTKVVDTIRLRVPAGATFMITDVKALGSAR